MLRPARTRFCLASLALLSLAPLSLAACTAKTTSPQKKTTTSAAKDAVAQVGDKAITARELEYRIAELSPAQQRHTRSSPKALEALLEQLIEERLILDLARRRGLDRDPRIRRIMHHHLVNLIREDVLEQVKLKKITDEQARRFYDQNKARFSTPGLLRGSQIVVADEKRAKALAARAARADDAGFAQLAKRHSTDALTRGRGGDLGPVRKPGRNLPLEAFKALSALKKVGETTQPIKAGSRWHILRLTAKKSPGLRPFSEVAVQAKLGAFRQQRALTFRQFRRELRAANKIRRFPKRLARVGKELAKR